MVEQPFNNVVWFGQEKKFTNKKQSESVGRAATNVPLTGKARPNVVGKRLRFQKVYGQFMTHRKLDFPIYCNYSRIESIFLKKVQESAKTAQECCKLTHGPFQPVVPTPRSLNTQFPIFTFLIFFFFVFYYQNPCGLQMHRIST